MNYFIKRSKALNQPCNSKIESTSQLIPGFSRQYPTFGWVFLRYAYITNQWTTGTVAQKYSLYFPLHWWHEYFLSMVRSVVCKEVDWSYLHPTGQWRAHSSTTFGRDTVWQHEKGESGEVGEPITWPRSFPRNIGWWCGMQVAWAHYFFFPSLPSPSWQKRSRPLLLLPTTNKPQRSLMMLHWRRVWARSTPPSTPWRSKM